MGIELILSALFGTGTGILGSILGQVGDYFKRKQELEVIKTQNAHELVLQDKQMEARKGEMENEQAIADTEAWTATRTASYEHDTSYGNTYKWVVAILRFVRPALTGALIVMVWDFVSDLPADDAVRMDAMNQIMFMTATALTWWFGDRRPNSKS